MSFPDDAFTGIVHPEVRSYLESLLPADPFLNRLEQYAQERKFPLVGRGSGNALFLLALSIGAKRVFELGSGWGYSALFFARAGAEVFGTDKDQHELDAFEQLFEGHPLKNQIHLMCGDALALLEQTPESFDIIFLDLDKRSYPEALERAIPRLRDGGLLIADNVLWGGKTARATEDPDTLALQRFNERLFSHPLLEASILPLGDGLGVARKKSL
jgi:predicted O-methyltransferase YrrM